MINSRPSFFLLVSFGLMGPRVTVYNLYGKIGCIFPDIFLSLSPPHNISD